MKELFLGSWDKSDPYWVIKVYFNIMYADGNFIEALTLLTSSKGLSTDGAYCHFLCHEHPNSREVEFAFGYPPTEEDEIIVDEAICFKYAREASELYLREHPDKAAIIERLVASIPA